MKLNKITLTLKTRQALMYIIVCLLVCLFVCLFVRVFVFDL